MSTNSFRYRIRKIETVNFNINSDVYRVDEKIKASISFDIKYYCQEFHTMPIVCSYRLKCENSDKPFLNAEIKIVYEFHSEDTDKAIYKKEDGLYFNPNAFRVFKQQIYDTLRGFIHAKTEGTSFNKFIVFGWEPPKKGESIKLKEEAESK